MATINFYLDNKPDRMDRKLILLTYQINGKKRRFSTKVKIYEKNWDSSKQCLKKNSEGQSEINELLKSFRRLVEVEEHEAMRKSEPLTFEKLSEKIYEFTSSAKVDNSFYSIFQLYIESSKTTKTVGTIKGYHSCLQKLQSFEKAKKYPLSFNSINGTFYEKFLHYLIVDNQHLNNTAGRYIKSLKAFMNYAFDKGYCSSSEYRKFKVFKEDVDIVYLTDQELNQLYQFNDLPERLNKVKDIFCFGCYTGLRFSDLTQVNEGVIKGDYLELKTIKTKDSLRIPLNKYAKQILDKYKNTLPKVMTNQKMNAYLKDVCQLAGIDDTIGTTEFQGAKRSAYKEPKYKLISTHTARRTFVTLSLQKGMRPEVIMAITGHKDYTSFKKYIKITENVKAEEMAKAWDN